MTPQSPHFTTIRADADSAAQRDGESPRIADIAAATGLLIAVALAFADASVVALALPDLYGEFDTSIPAVSWVLTSYALAVVAAGLASIWLIRRLSPARMAAFGAVGFAAASAAAGLAPTLPALIAARIAQGAGAAMLIAAAFPLLAAILGDRTRAAWWWAMAGTAGAAIGPALGGAVTQLFHWRAVFIIQAPLVVGALVASHVAGRRRESVSLLGADVEARNRPGRRPAGALTADGALSLTFAALVGALFLGVLLLVVVWDLEPLAGAAVVSALPAGTLAASAAGTRSHPAGLAIAGGALLSGGLATMAVLPSLSPWWVTAAMLLAGIGFGLLVKVLGPVAVPEAGSPRAAGLSSVWRHLGLVIGLAVIAPVLASNVTAASERAPLPAAAALLDAPIGGVTKVQIALDIRDAIAQAPDGRIPGLDTVFAANGAGSDPAVAQLQSDIEDGVRSTITGGFRAAFGIAALFAASAGAAAVLAVARAGTASRREPSDAVGVVGAPTRRPGWVSVGIVGGALLVAFSTPAAAAAAAPEGGLGTVGLADPCLAPADPYPGSGVDVAVQRLVLSGLNGAACELGISREELVLSLEPSAGIAGVEWDRATIERALRSGVLGAIDDGEERDGLPDWLATGLSWAVERAPLSWFLERLGVE
jgi:predicted MFS family arabinose efflux permease